MTMVVHVGRDAEIKGCILKDWMQILLFRFESGRGSGGLLVMGSMGNVDTNERKGSLKDFRAKKVVWWVEATFV